MKKSPRQCGGKMSILVSVYFPEGIVFAADKNITTAVNSKDELHKYVEPTGTKVLSWPNKKAIIGYVGLARLAGVPFEEYIRIFIAETRNFSDIEEMANQLRDQIQQDFSEEFATKEVFDQQLIIHLGGFTKKEDVSVPFMYHIWNYSGIFNANTGKYPPGERVF
jgi:hypothetical protein